MVTLISSHSLHSDGNEARLRQICPILPLRQTGQFPIIEFTAVPPLPGQLPLLHQVAPHVAHRRVTGGELYFLQWGQLGTYGLLQVN